MTKEDWARHYDTLLWTTTTIFLTAIGVFFTYVNSHPDIWLSLFGLILSGSTVYFAASFRQLRYQEGPKGKIRKGLLQWYPYLFIFWCIGELWIRLISYSCYVCFWCIFVSVSLAWSAYIIFMAIGYGKPKDGHEPDFKLVRKRLGSRDQTYAGLINTVLPSGSDQHHA